MKKSSWILMASTLILGLQSLPVLPASALTPQELINRLKQKIAQPKADKTGFTGTRTLKVYRQNTEPQVASAKIIFADKDNYDLHITDPLSIRGIHFNMKNGVNSVYFPDEQLFLVNGGKDTSYMPERIILSSFSPRPELIPQNYDIKILNGNGAIKGVPAYQVEFIPKIENHTVAEDGKTPVALTPRRRDWLDQKTLQVLKEERFWDSIGPDGKWVPSTDPYSIADYEIYSPGPKPAIPTLDPQGINKVNLSGQEKNSFLTYKTVQEAEAKEGIKMTLPKQLPKGFVLKDIQVFTLFGARIQVQNYTDGLNDMMITVRPQQNAFVTLMAGAFSLNLIKKVTDLSTQAPNNYSPISSENRIAVVFGDVMPIELGRVGKSMDLTIK